MPAGIPKPSLDENISSTLSSGITDVATSMDVADASKIVSPCYLVVDRVDSAGTLKATSLWEYFKVTNVAGNTLTITRAQGGSTGQAHSSGAVVEAVVTSTMFEDWYNVLNPEHDSAGGHVITGTMTIAGMNLASVATIAVGSFNRVNVVTYLNASGASISGLFPAAASAIGTDGWTTSDDTWVYATASTFTITGVNRTAIYTKGTKIKWTQSTAKYGVVVSSAFGTDTTVTIAVNTDHVIANAAITSPFYSYQNMPADYPARFNFTPTYSSGGGAFTNAPTLNEANFAVVGGKWVHYFVKITYNATSGGSGDTLIQSLPFTINANEPFGWGAGRSYTNGWQCVAYADTTTQFGFSKYDGLTAIANSASMAVGCWQPI